MTATRSIPTRRTNTLIVGMLLAVTCFLVITAKADAKIYWTNEGAGNVGRANLDGTSPQSEFLSGVGDSIGLAVYGSHVYWANANGAIGRANLDGTEIEPEFIPGLNSPFSVAVDSGHIYWTSPYVNEIGRAKIDGTEVEPAFITEDEAEDLLEFPWQIAVSGGRLYWADYSGNSIATANTNGTEVNLELVSNAEQAQGLTVQGEYVYWTNGEDQSIERAKLDGSEVTNYVVREVTSQALASDSEHLYWANWQYGGVIGRSELDGSEPEEEFITIGTRPEGLAVGPEAVPPGPGPTPTPTPTPKPPAQTTKPSTSSSPPACVQTSATAGTFTPTAMPGKVVPGVRLQLGTSSPSQLSVAATLVYPDGKGTRKAALGTYGLHVSGHGNLRIALPTALRSLLPKLSKVQVSLRMLVTPDAGSGVCGGSFERSASVPTKVVDVLAAKAVSP